MEPGIVEKQEYIKEKHENEIKIPISLVQSLSISISSLKFLNSNLNTSAGVPPTILSPLPSRPQVQVFLEPLDIRDQLPFIFLAATVAIGGYSVPNTGMLKGFVNILYKKNFCTKISQSLKHLNLKLSMYNRVQFFTQ
jgi:hypothetical protein